MTVVRSKIVKNKMNCEISLLVMLLIGVCFANEKPGGSGKQHMVANNIISQKLFSALRGVDKPAINIPAPTAHIHKEDPQHGSTLSMQKHIIDDDDEADKKKPPLDLRDVWKNTFGVRDPLTWLATRREELGFELPEGDDGTGERKVPPLDLRKVWKDKFGVRDPITWLAERRDDLGYE